MGKVCLLHRKGQKVSVKSEIWLRSDIFWLLKIPYFIVFSISLSNVQANFVTWMTKRLNSFLTCHVGSKLAGEDPS